MLKITGIVVAKVKIFGDDGGILTKFAKQKNEVSRQPFWQLLSYVEKNLQVNNFFLRRVLYKVLCSDWDLWEAARVDIYIHIIYVQSENIVKTKVNSSFLLLFNFLVMILIHWFSLAPTWESTMRKYHSLILCHRLRLRFHGSSLYNETYSLYFLTRESNNDVQDWERP